MRFPPSLPALCASSWLLLPTACGRTLETASPPATGDAASSFDAGVESDASTGSVGTISQADAARDAEGDAGPATGATTAAGLPVSELLGGGSPCSYVLAGVDVAGYITGMTVSRTGSDLVATLDYDDAGTIDLRFTATSGTSATLAPAPQTLSGATFGCTDGPMDSTPATFTATSGTLSYDSNSICLSLAGTVVADPSSGTSCNRGNPLAAIAFICAQGDAGSPFGQTADAAPPPSTNFEAGTYTCTDGVLGQGSADGQTADFVSGGTSTLTLAAGAGPLSVTWSGDSFASGSLDFVATSGTSAALASNGQTASVQCTAPMPGPMPGAAPPTNDVPPLSVASGALTIDGDLLFVTFGGVFATDAGGSPFCAGAQMATSLICMKE